jgi:uncharacterized protein (TIGR03437 family)
MVPYAGHSAPLSDATYLSNAYFTAAGSKGEVYVSPGGCVLRIAADETISRYAGICTKGGKSDDGGPATEASLWLNGIAADQAGNLYILEWGYYRIRKVTPDGIISTIAGTGANGCTGDGGLAVNAGFGKVYAIAIDTKGSIYANCDNSVRKISPDGKITTVYVLTSGFISALACDRAGNVYVMADLTGQGFGIIHRVSPDGKDVVFAGGAYSHDDGIPALQSWIASADSMAIDAGGNVYMVDGGNIYTPGPERRPMIRKIDGTTGIISKFAGNGALGTVGDGGPLSAASLNSPGQLAIDSNGNLVFPDSGRVRRILLNAVPPKIELVASPYTAAMGDGPRSTATFGGLAGIARDKSGNLYVADTGYSRIRKIGTDDMVTTIAGTASWGFDGDGDATAHSLFSPFGIDFDSQGNLWIADSKNLRLRKVTPSGKMSTEAVFGVDYDSLGFVKAGPPGKVVFLVGDFYLSTGVYPNQLGSLYELSNGQWSLVRVPVVGSTGVPLSGMTFDSSGNIYVGTYSYTIQKIDSAGVVTTFAGTPGKRGSSGDGGPATAALLDTPSALTSDSQGNIYFIDGDPQAVIRKISRGGALIETVAAGYVKDLVVDPAGVIYATGGGGVLKFTPVPADGISILSGDRQIGSVGTQLPQPLVVGITGASGSIPFKGVAVQFTVSSGTAKPSSDSAITGADGTTSVSVTLGSQTGPVAITASVPGLPSATFRLTAQVPCSFTLDRTAISAPSAGAYGSIALTAAPALCMWTATSRDTWVTLTSAASGAGSATINYTVAPNPGPARSSIWLIAGASVAISQQAGPPGPLILPVGVVSASSNQPVLAPGALATIYGKNLTGRVTVFNNFAGTTSWGAYGNSSRTIGGLPLAESIGFNFVVPSGNDLAFTGGAYLATFGSGINSVNLALRSDSGGLPGAALESIALANVLAQHCDGSGCAIVPFGSSVNPALLGGHQYWLTAEMANPSTSVSAWWMPNEYDPGLVAYSNNGGPWSAGPTTAPYGRCAFQILGGSVAKATTVPLPTSLGGASVSLGGRAVPLTYVSPTQINFQVPYETPLGTASLTVTANGVASAAASFTVASSAPGVLTYGDNWAVVQNQDYSVNGPSNPAKVGSYVTLYGTGAGAVSPAVPTGAAAPAVPLSNVANITASINGVPATVTFAGLTPGSVGLLQVNLRIPTLPGGTFPIQIAVGDVKSNAPSIAVLP